jgi:MYXO-CTERM domain-containing protein
MKKLMITAAALMIACAAYGQGQFFLNTHDTTAGNVLTFTFNGAPASGSDLFAEVSAGPDAQHLTALTPLFALNRTGAGAGFASPFSNTYTVAGMAGGATATVAINAFKGASSSTASASSGVQVLGTVVLTEPPTPPSEVAIGTKTIAIVPEPGTLALGLVGLGTLLAFRRRN